MKDKIKIIKEDFVEWNINPSMKCLKINDRIYDKNIIVSPCAAEHWISTDLFKFRLYCQKKQIHVTGVCPINQIPLFSLFSDDIAIVEDNPSWYEYKHATTNGSSVKKISDDHVDIENGNFRTVFSSEISDDEVIENYKQKTVCILKSAYDLFRKIKHELSSGIIVIECKQEFKYALKRCLSNEDLPISGFDYSFQKDLLDKVGKENYMSTQILASNFLNWQYICYGGASNLMCVLPVKYLVLRDPTLNNSVIKIVQGFMKAKGYEKIPFFNGITNPGKLIGDFKILKNWDRPEIIEC
ncbi:MAG: hypothetical protein DWQ19_11235 [Crenarchaeota archaeon]|nr:MAG: hypothetical protein DWQ19_11235 [Thermoproteota archaeon]